MNQIFGLQNFRVFKEYTEIELAPITILTGTNSCGKSSIVKAIRLLKYNFQKQEQHFKAVENLSFNDPKNNLGGFSKVISQSATSDSISFATQYDHPFLGILKAMITYKKGYGNEFDNDSGEISHLEVFQNEVSILSFETVLTEELSIGYTKDWIVNTSIDKWYSFYQDLLYSADHQLKEVNLFDKTGDKIAGKKDFQTKQKELMNKNFFGDGLLISLPKLEIIRKAGLFDHDGILDPDACFNPLLNNLEKEEIVNISSMLVKSEINNWEQLLPILQNLEKQIFQACLGLKRPVMQHDTDFPKWNSKRSVSEEYMRVEPSSFSELMEEFLNENFLDDNFRNLQFKNSFEYYFVEEFKGNKSHQSIELFESKYGKERNPNFINSINEFFKPIIEIIKLGLNSFKSFAQFEFIPAERIKLNRVYHLTDNDEFVSTMINYMNLERRIESDDFNASKSVREEFLQKWLKEFEIGNKFIIEGNDPNWGIQPIIEKDGKQMPLTDVGFGINQLIPLLLKIITYPNESTFIIEEPESNLHPALQSKIADLLIDAYNEFGLKFIIETHSEYLIRKLQYWVAKKTIKADDLRIYYLYHPDNLPHGAKQVEQIEIDEFGNLTQEFGAGFFDEAINWKFELLRLKNAQRN